MSRPSWAAWQAALHMLKWMIRNKNVGIKFTKGGNIFPVGFVDASNKPDPGDGKCQFGFNLMWMGGPIFELSKKLRHIGLSSEHNEYNYGNELCQPGDCVDASAFYGDGTGRMCQGSNCFIR